MNLFDIDVSALTVKFVDCNRPVQGVHNVFLELMLIAEMFIFRTKLFFVLR